MRLPPTPTLSAHPLPSTRLFRLNLDCPDIGGTWPGKHCALPTHVEPASPPASARRPVMAERRARTGSSGCRPAVFTVAGLMVEAPGTAPGSVTFIPRSVYRHSRFPDPVNLGQIGRASCRERVCQYV